MVLKDGHNRVMDMQWEVIYIYLRGLVAAQHLSEDTQPESDHNKGSFGLQRDTISIPMVINRFMCCSPASHLRFTSLFNVVLSFARDSSDHSPHILTSERNGQGS